MPAPPPTLFRVCPDFSAAPAAAPYVRETPAQAKVRKAALTKRLVSEYITLSNQLCSQLKQAQAAFKTINDRGTASAAKAVAASLDLKLLWAMGALPLTENNKRLLRSTMPAGIIPLGTPEVAVPVGAATVGAPGRKGRLGGASSAVGRPYVHSTHPSRRSKSRAASNA